MDAALGFEPPLEGPELALDELGFEVEPPLDFEVDALGFPLEPEIPLDQAADRHRPSNR